MSTIVADIQIIEVMLFWFIDLSISIWNPQYIIYIIDYHTGEVLQTYLLYNYL